MTIILNSGPDSDPTVFTGSEVEVRAELLDFIDGDRSLWQSADPVSRYSLEELIELLEADYDVVRAD